MSQLIGTSTAASKKGGVITISEGVCACVRVYAYNIYIIIYFIERHFK